MRSRPVKTTRPSPTSGRSAAKNTVVELDVTSIVPYPQQARVYGGLSASSTKMLTKSMSEDRQRDPVVALPAGNAAGLPAFTLIDGHQRLAIARSLGWKTLRAVVRWDLANASAEEIHNLFLRINLERRQLLPMQQARVLVELYEATTGRTLDRFSGDDWRQVTGQVARHLDLSVRNAQRYVRICNTPPAIERAVREGRLRLALAERIETLPRPKQEELAARIEKIDDPKEANALVARYLPSKPRRSGRSFGKGLKNLADALEAADAAIGDQLDGALHASWLPFLAPMLTGKALLDRLVAALRAIDPDADPLGDLMKSISQ